LIIFFENRSSNTANNAPHGTFYYTPVEEMTKFYEKELNRIRREFQAELKKSKTD